MTATVPVTWQGRVVHAAAPEEIAGLDVDLTAAAARRTERAAAAVRRAGDRATGGLEVAARLLLRSEGLASSAIEGLRPSPTDVALAEVGGLGDGSHLDEGVAGWVADNLAVVSDALATAGPLDAERLMAWHERLMRSAPAIDARHVGAYRDTLGWVGGPNPMMAAHVAVPHGAIPPLMEDLFAYVARHDVDPVTQAAVAHAQFETIHPFADGNGRLGRVLVGRVLAHRLEVAVPPPISLALTRDIGGYLAGLTLFRQGFAEHWVSWFAGIVESAADRSTEVLAAVGEVQRSWVEATAGFRADAAARRVLPLLPSHPVVSAGLVARLLGVSGQAAGRGLQALVEAGVLSETERAGRRRGRPERWYVAHGLLDLLGH